MYALSQAGALPSVLEEPLLAPRRGSFQLLNRCMHSGTCWGHYVLVPLGQVPLSRSVWLGLLKKTVCTPNGSTGHRDPHRCLWTQVS